MENSGIGRMLTVLTSPGKTFCSIAERPTWAAPLVLFMLLTALVGFLVHQRTDYREVMEWTVQHRGMEMDQDRMDKAVDMQERFGGVGAVIGSVVVVIFTLLVTLLYLLGLKLAGGELKYVDALAVGLYGSMPVAVQLLLTAAVLLPRKTLEVSQIMSRNFLASNLGFFAPADAGPVLNNLLACFDVFAIWALVLLVIGFRRVAKVSTAGATAVVVVVWLLGVGIRVGFAALSAGGLG
jgi:hypothetical protein